MSRAYKAKWIITSREDQNNEIYENCALIVDEGKIVDIKPQSELLEQDYKQIKDYGNCVITPGFINLLSYLQSTSVNNNHKLNFLSKIKKFFRTLYLKYTFAGVPENSYAKRISKLLNNYYSMSANDKIDSFKKGLELSLLSGTTCIVEILNSQKYFDAANKSPLKTFLFFELFADSVDNGKKEFKSIKKKIEKLMYQKSANTFIGVAPNSICNVHKRLWKILSKYCRKNNLLMLIHLAESQDEIDWLNYGFSDIDLLHKFCGFKKLSPHTKSISPVEYLKKLSVLSKKVLIANGNYLNLDQLYELSQTEVKFVYTPRFDDKVCNKKQSLENIISIFGKRFGFGTDSLANNDDLNIFNEAKYANQNNNLDLIQLIKHLTIYPAKILRLDYLIGSLEPNKHADFNIFMLNDGETYRDLINKTNPDYVYINGKRIVDKSKIRIR